jgi:diguanylate cyclase (GGDEF)-like protein/PAS domain S-box-containing protein
MSNITGVNEVIDIEANVETALTVHPGTKTLVFILSTGTVSDRRFAVMAESRIFPTLRKRFEVLALKDVSLAEIRAALVEVSLDSVVFLGGQARDMREGRPLDLAENARFISPLSPVPVYAFWDFQLGTGVLGGRILSGREQGREAAEIGLRILAGVPADSIPVRMDPPTETVFDYKVMQRFGLVMDSLPPDSRVINLPEDAWTRHQREILGGLGLIAVETLLIVALGHAMRQRKRALAALETERALLETRVMERTEELQMQREQLEEALLTRNLLLNNALVVIALVRNRRFVWISNHVSEVVGYAPEECIGRSTVFVYYYPEDYQRLWREAASVLRGGGTYRGDYCYRRKDGTPLWCTLSARALDPGDLEKGILFVVVDINSRKLMENDLREAKAHLEVLSTTDQLTGLSNRRRLADILECEINRARRYNQPFSIIMLDLDHFKRVNDTFGHDVGDYVLRTVARILAKNLRSTDVAGRWGGEEFMIICPATNLESAMVLAELIRLRIEDHDYAMPGKVTASMGVAAYSADTDPDTLVKLADEALYAAKAAGRNCVQAAGSAP